MPGSATYIDNVLREWWDDDTRTYYEYDEAGVETLNRPYEEIENVYADQRQLSSDIEVATLAQQRAVSENAAPQETATLQVLHKQAIGQVEGDLWLQPMEVNTAYPLDWVVSHNGKTWTSLVASNVWEPGVANWREAGSDWPEWVQPSGAHDAYPMGAQVTHNELRWVSDVSANVWEPGVYGWTQQT